MGRKKAKANYRRIVLRLPDLDHSKTAVLNSLTSPASRRVYKYAIEIRGLVLFGTTNRLQSHRCSSLSHTPGILLSGREYHQSASGCGETLGKRSRGRRSPQSRLGRRHCSREGRQAVRSALRQLADSRPECRCAQTIVWREPTSQKRLCNAGHALRLRFRRAELAGLELDEIQTRQGHWAIVDLIGKGDHIRVPFPYWAKQALDGWISAAGITKGRIFRAVARGGKIWGSGISENVVWYVVRNCCQRTGLGAIAPHDLRRTCARSFATPTVANWSRFSSCWDNASVLTTECYLGCKQNLGHPVNDLFDLKMEAQLGEHKSESGAPEASAAFKRPPQNVGYRRGDLEGERLSTVSGDQQSQTPRLDTGT